MVDFGGWEMPVQYENGILKEHLGTRRYGGLFDVSHMGQVLIKGKNFLDVAQELETLMPISITQLSKGRQRYGFLTNASGGIIDDLMLSNRGDHVYMVVNAACKNIDVSHIIKNVRNLRRRWSGQRTVWRTSHHAHFGWRRFPRDLGACTLSISEIY